MLKKQFKILFFLALLSITNGAFANEIAVYVSFNIIGSSCTVTTSDITFNFYLDAADLAEANSSTDWQSLPGQTIRLINCFSGTNNVEASVSGTIDEIDRDGFKNMATGGAVATNVSVQLKSGTQILHNLDTLTFIPTSAQSVDIPLSARLYSTQGNVAPGDVYSVINLTLTYK